MRCVGAGMERRRPRAIDTQGPRAPRGTPTGRSASGTTPWNKETPVSTHTLSTPIEVTLSRRDGSGSTVYTATEYHDADSDHVGPYVCAWSVRDEDGGDLPRQRDDETRDAESALSEALRARLGDEAQDPADLLRRVEDIVGDDEHLGVRTIVDCALADNPRVTVEEIVEIVREACAEAEIERRHESES
jgi:hypothetical protein